MKKKLSTVIISLITMNSIFAQAPNNYLYAGSIPGCVARWTFDEPGNTLIDHSNNNNNGVLSNTTSASGWRNLPLQGAKFNGFSSGGVVANASTLQITDATIVTLIKFDAFNTALCQGSNILSKGNDYDAGVYLVRANDNEYDHDCGLVNPDKNSFIARFENDGSTFTQKPIIDTGKWYFFAVTFKNGTEMKYYEVLMDTGNYAPPLQPTYALNTSGYSMGINNQPIYIGKHNSASFPYFLNGVLDELVIFNRVLDVKELVDVYDFLWNRDASTNIGVNKIAEQVNYVRTGKRYQFSVADNVRYNAVLTDMLGRRINSFTLGDNAVVDLGNYEQQMFLLTLYNEYGKHTIKLQN